MEAEVCLSDMEETSRLMGRTCELEEEEEREQAVMSSEDVRMAEEEKWTTRRKAQYSNEDIDAPMFM